MGHTKAQWGKTPTYFLTDQVKKINLTISNLFN